MKTIFCLLLSLAAVPGWAKVPLSQAVTRGLALSAALQNQQLDTETARINRQNASYRKWFNVDSGFSYLYKSQQMEIEFPTINAGPGIIIPGRTIVAGAKNNYDLRLTLSQPLFTGGLLSQTVQRETLNATAETLRSQAQHLEVAGRIKISYFNYRLLAAHKRYLELLLQKMDLHRRRQENLLTEELIRKSDLLETQTQIEETQLSLSDVEQLLAAEAIHFQRLSGYAADEIDENYSEEASGLDDALRLLRERHPALLALDEQRQMAETQKRIVAAAYRPQLLGFAELHYGRPGIDFFKNSWSFYGQGGLSLNLPLFNWNRSRRDLRLSAIAAEKIANQRRDLLEEMEQNLRQLFSLQQSIESKLEHSRRLREYSGENARLKEQLYLENQTDHRDYLAALLDAERYAAQDQELQIQRQLIRIQINTLMGRQLEEQ